MDRNLEDKLREKFRESLCSLAWEIKENKRVIKIRKLAEKKLKIEKAQKLAKKYNLPLPYLEEKLLREEKEIYDAPYKAYTPFINLKCYTIYEVYSRRISYKLEDKEIANVEIESILKVKKKGYLAT